MPKTDAAQTTLRWLLREGDGESLDEIARDVDLPAPRVRQRVSRLRRHLHARWLALGAAGLLLLLVAGALSYRASQRGNEPPSIAREPMTPLERARILRQNALQRCAAGAYPECIAALDQAKALDPRGESASAIHEARAAAANSEQPPELLGLAGGPPRPSAPDVESTEKQNAPRELDPKRLVPSKFKPKQLAPSKPSQKREALGAAQERNALPDKLGVPSSAQLLGREFPHQQPKTPSEKRLTPLESAHWIGAERDAIAVGISGIAREFGAGFDDGAGQLEPRLELLPVLGENRERDQERSGADAHHGSRRRVRWLDHQQRSA